MNVHGVPPRQGVLPPKNAIEPEKVLHYHRSHDRGLTRGQDLSFSFIFPLLFISLTAKMNSPEPIQKTLSLTR
jgi:hypothetical protein